MNGIDVPSSGDEEDLTFTLTIHTTTRAFKPFPETEVARILQKLVNHLEPKGCCQLTSFANGCLRDKRGELIGVMRLVPFDRASYDALIENEGSEEDRK